MTSVSRRRLRWEAQCVHCMNLRCAHAPRPYAHILVCTLRFDGPPSFICGFFPILFYFCLCLCLVARVCTFIPNVLALDKKRRKKKDLQQFPPVNLNLRRWTLKILCWMSDMFARGQNKRFETTSWCRCHFTHPNLYVNSGHKGWKP